MTMYNHARTHMYTHPHPHTCTRTHKHAHTHNHVHTLNSDAFFWVGAGDTPTINGYPAAYGDNVYVKGPILYQL